MKKFLAILIAGAFATSMFADETPLVATDATQPEAVVTKTDTKPAKTKHHKRKHHKKAAHKEAKPTEAATTTVEAQPM